MDAAAVALLSALPDNDASAARWVDDWLRHPHPTMLLQLASFLVQHNLLTLEVCGDILDELLGPPCRYVLLLTEAEIERGRGSEADTKASLLVRALLFRCATILSDAHALRRHFLARTGPEVMVLAMASPISEQLGLFDDDVALGSPYLFVQLCGLAWEGCSTHWRGSGNTSRKYWQATRRITRAAVDSCCRTGFWGATRLPVAHLAGALSRTQEAPDAPEAPDVEVAIEMCMYPVTAAISDQAWRGVPSAHAREVMGPILQGAVPRSRYRSAVVRRVLLAGIECAQPEWTEAFTEPAEVEHLAVQLLIDAVPAEPGLPASPRHVHAAVRLLGMLGTVHPERAVFESVFWSLSDLLGVLALTERKAVVGAHSPGNHRLLQEMLPHCMPEQRRWWRQLCGYTASVGEPSDDTGLDALTDLPNSRLYRFHDHAGSMPVSLESIRRHFLAADDVARDPFTRVPVSRDSVVELQRKN